MHFERVGHPREHQHVRLAAPPEHQARVRAVARHLLEGALGHPVGVQAPQGRALPQRRDHDRRRTSSTPSTGCIDQTKKSPQYGNIRAIKEVRVVNPETVHIITDKPFPLLLERLVFFPIVPKKHIEAVGDQAFGTTSPVGTGPVEVRRVEARPAHPPRGLRPALARQAAVQAPRLPRRPRDRHPGGRDQDGRRGHHPQRLRRHRPRAQDPPAGLHLLDAHPARPLRRARHALGALRQEGSCARRRTTRSTSRPSSRS